MTRDLDPRDLARRVSRRSFLTQGGLGLGGLALAQLMGTTAPARAASPSEGSWQGTLRPPHFPIKARRVIHLCMAGGPSQFETFDWKPALKDLHGKPFPESLTKGQQLAQLQGAKLIARGSFAEFKKWGQSGVELSTLFPRIGGVADELCVIRSMVTEQINHDPAHAFMNSWFPISARL